ncbi:MAG: sialate O-acetylesterase [Bacteroidales bacterium]
MKHLNHILLSAILIFCTILSYAKVSTPHFFSDNMVLQRNQVIKIWGKADKKEAVSINFNGKTVSTVTGKDGIWHAELPAMKHGGPYEMTIKGNSNTISFKNILIGDVWLCSGQSNMEWNLGSSNGGKQENENSENSNIRLIQIPKNIQSEEVFDTRKTQWTECNPETSKSFSAVGYYFGKKLQTDLDVPIGLINSSWGGTDIEPWTSWEGSMGNDEYAKYKGKSVVDVLGYTAEDVEEFKHKLANDPGIPGKWYDPKTKVKGWKEMELPGIWEDKIGEEDGIIWFKKEIELPASVEGEKGKINLGSIDDNDITWINGEKVGAIGFFMANRNYEIKSGILKAGKNTVIVSVTDGGGNGGFGGKPEDMYIEVDGKKYSIAGEWACKPSVLSSEYGFGNRGTGPNAFASILYNGMIAPLVGYGIKGAIWYQGENNAGEAYRYRTLFPNMIKDWRNKWEYEFPFLWVQLASFMASDEQPTDSEWAELREAQNMTLSLPKTGQAVITDIGEAFDIHPRNKKDVSERLAHSALNIAYGKDVLASGPIYKEMKIEDSRATLSFSSIGDGLGTLDNCKYGYVKGFAIAGEDKKFEWAKAYILDNKVIVWSEKVKNPVAVRYGWMNNNIEDNLINSEGLLASPFRTDNWKGITEK